MDVSVSAPLAREERVGAILRLQPWIGQYQKVDVLLLLRRAL